MGDEHWKVAILYAEFFYLSIKEVLDFVPDAVGPRAQDVTSTDVIVFYHFCLCYYLEQNFCNVVLVLGEVQFS